MIWLIVLFITSAAGAALWVKAVMWARRRDQADRDAAATREMEETLRAT